MNLLPSRHLTSFVSNLAMLDSPMSICIPNLPLNQPYHPSGSLSDELITSLTWFHSMQIFETYILIT